MPRAHQLLFFAWSGLGVFFLVDWYQARHTTSLLLVAATFLLAFGNVMMGRYAARARARRKKQTAASG